MATGGPRSWDWRDHIQMPSVRDQGEYQACVSLAAVGMIEARRRLVHAATESLVAGYIHHCRLGIYDKATSANPDVVLDICRDHGVAIGYDNRIPLPAEECPTFQQLLRIEGWERLTGQTDILHELGAGGPLLTSMWIEKESFSRLGNDVYHVAPDADTFLHAVLLVGFDLDAGWVSFLNCAGPSWGNNGYGRVAIGSGGVITGRDAFAALV